ncbi:MAG: CRISPR-associated endonuclease Cas3'' [Candidatus Methanosuratincola petrocarbonis]
MTAFAYTNQELKRHSVNTMNHALKHSGENYAEVCVKRIRSASGSPIFSPDEFIGLVRVAAALHDSGKAADSYQRQFQGTPPERPSFYLHEIPSAIITKGLMEEAGYDPDSVFLVSLAVLSHHTAMRTYSRQERLLDKANQPWTFRKCKSDLDELSESILGTKLHFSRIDRDCAKNFMEWVDRMAGDCRNNSFAKLYCLILSPVIYGDNIDAQSRGGYNKSRFVEELEETIDG